jgi:hypothetical protein
LFVQKWELSSLFSVSSIDGDNIVESRSIKRLCAVALKLPEDTRAEKVALDPGGPRSLYGDIDWNEAAPWMRRREQERSDEWRGPLERL